MVTSSVTPSPCIDTEAYFAALTAYRDGRPAEIVAPLSNATCSAIANGGQLVGDLRRVRAGWRERISARRDAVVWRVADLLLRRCRPRLTG